MDTFIKSVAGIRIYVEPNGKFTATIGGKDVHRASVGAVEKLVTESLAAMEFTVIPNWWKKEDLRQVEVVRYEKTGKTLKAGGRLGRFEEIFLPTPKELEQLRELAKQENEINRKWVAIRQKCKQVSREDFEAMRAQKGKSLIERGIYVTIPSGDPSYVQK